MKDREDNAKPIGAGKSSFDLIDAARFLAVFAPQAGEYVLDAACGPGRYTFFLARREIPRLKILAVDLWAEGVNAVKQEAEKKGFANVESRVADISRRIPVESDRIDRCLMATVVHDLIEAGSDKEALAEIRRVMKPGGILAVVEFKKIEGPPGPPLAIRLSETELAERLEIHGFDQQATTDVGEFLYLSSFVLSGSA